MNEVMQGLVAHRSIRKYKSDPIPETLLNDLLRCGLAGSSSGNMNTWSVIVSSDAARREKLYALHHEQPMVQQAPIVLTFCADFRRMRRWVKLRQAKDSFDDLAGFLIAAIDAVIAAQNVAVAAESAGLGICYMGTTLYSAPGIAQFLMLPENVVPVTSLVVGYPDEDPAPRSRLPLDFVVHRETYTDLPDEEILANYQEREIAGWKRYRESPELMAEMAAHGITHLAQYYTSDLKYSKALHEKISREYFELLRQKGYWNFGINGTVL